MLRLPLPSVVQVCPLIFAATTARTASLFTGLQLSAISYARRKGLYDTVIRIGRCNASFGVTGPNLAAGDV